ncbi:MAG: glycosyltransferase family 4 protein [Lactobacillus kefiranofaciens]|uniref:glycosyltransferase family 4 protein n=1 Tax=Lactobacillus kefiranofaciens TaxID=267818 RepID=UPI00166E10D9|nr:glycosyltransferase family 4 protein [Lactobacillus kefiranofaciens]QNT43943.1 glycosyltransferase family 4 protein [Lactobacillus kefiranofaciens]
MKVAYITRKSADDIKVWSGTRKYIFDNLTQICDVTNIVVPVTTVHKIVHKIIHKITFNRINYSKIDKIFEKREIQKKLTEINKYDILFFVAQSDILSSSLINKDKKIIYLSDATYRAMLGYYYFNVPQSEVKWRDFNEKVSLCKSSQIILTSNWAKNSAEQNYKITSTKLNVIPFGANMPDEYKEKITPLKNVRLLIVGVDWKRKGIDIAIKTVKLLNLKQNKYHFILNVVGFKKPADTIYPDFIRFQGRLNKNKKEELKKMIFLYQNSDIFVFPTQAECSAISLCEAAMYGLPVVTYKTGGLTTYVKNNESGFLLSPNSTERTFSKKILEILNNNLFINMSKQSRELYIYRLNWNSWKEKVNNIILECMKETINDKEKKKN